MSYVAAHDTREQVRQATDIAELIGSYLELRRQGRNFVARCPWHDDQKPSLQINPERQSWKCWVCDVGGDIFSFVMKREGVDFREALHMLADRAGLQITPQKQTPIQPGSPDDKRTLFQAMAWAEQQFQDCLVKSSDGEPARKYLAERGITGDSIGRFRIGYSPDNWQWLLDRARSTPYSPAVLEAVGLIGTSPNGGRQYDRLRGRVIFPIRDLQSRPIAFGGRVLPGAPADAPKYWNSPETRLFTKSDNLYALDLARDTVAKGRQIIVMEGYTDVIVAHQAGIPEAVACLGTALNERHIRLLKRFADTIYLVLDGDEAGQRRTNQILELFVAEQMDLRILTLPDEFDPAEFLLARPADEFRQMLAAAVDALEHKIRVETRGLDPARDTHRANRALEGILSTIAKAPRLPSGTAASGQLREQQILARLAREFRIPETTIRQRLSELRSNSKAGSVSATTPESPLMPGAMLKAIPPKELELLEIFSLHPELVECALDQIGTEHLTAAPAKAIFESYRRVYESGEPVEFTRVLTSLDDARLKSLLVQIDDRAQDKAALANEHAALRLNKLIDDFRQLEAEPERQEKLATLENETLNSAEEATLLKHLYELERLRRGLSAT